MRCSFRYLSQTGTRPTSSPMFECPAERGRARWKNTGAAATRQRDRARMVTVPCSPARSLGDHAPRPEVGALPLAEVLHLADRQRRSDLHESGESHDVRVPHADAAVRDAARKKFGEARAVNTYETTGGPVGQNGRASARTEGDGAVERITEVGEL